ncbi:D-TA family PLP-dependent enzyme [Gordonia liuliyuniae]|uniref:D-TA family PLP-dependent enzyme n=1 Tax=Gordonia liuliyuniae TaxID=2911517 RepID=A0ABS9IPC5_9ACTN|nr:D-TA family PLP-dependent enzyme [Gordonia liuliyuniae]MCF8587415.1 D-TA family PLP-dependent enzyme [Gordonia liuliyuniae]
MGDMVSTPTVIVDVDILDRNIAAMADAVQANGLALRPHIKTHKIVEIARKQIAAGATGLTVATIGEAEVFADPSGAAVDDLFIAYPLWLTRSSAARLVAASEQARISFGVDSVEGVRNAGARLGDAARRFEVLIEVDSGHHRSGVHPDGVTEIAAAADDAGLHVAGVFTFPGHSYGVGQADSAAHDEAKSLRKASRLLAESGVPVKVRSGGSTPTALLSDGGALTELRPGVYVFGDAQQWELGRTEPADIALTVLATVISRSDGPERRIVLDAGSKVLGADRPGYASGFGRLIDYPDARVTGLSEHHATVEFPGDAKLPVRGSRVRVVPNHVCTVLNLVDEVAVAKGGLIVDVWRVAARGRNN